VANITWNVAATADWNTPADWSTGAVPDTRDSAFISLPGAYVVTIGTAEAITVHSLTESAGVLTVEGTLAVNGASTITTGGAIDGGNGAGTIGPYAFITGTGALLNQGVIAGDFGGGALFVQPATFTNVGTVLADAAGIAVISSADFTNLSLGTLTGGVYEANGAGAAINFYTPAGDAAITTDDATLTLIGDGSAILGYDTSTGAYVNLTTSLSGIGAEGTLNILGGDGYDTTNTLSVAGVLRLGGGMLTAAGISDAALVIGYGTVVAAITSTGTVEANGGILTLAGGVSNSGALVVDADATMALNGTFTAAVTDNGSVQAACGLLDLAGGVTGSGGFSVQGGTSGDVTTLELAGAVGGKVTFNGAYGDLLLNSPSLFNGSIIGFGAGDTIDLAGLAANGATLSDGTLNVTYNSTLVDSLSAPGLANTGSFTAQGDGNTGTDITVAGLTPQDYAFEGPLWSSKTITWTFASSNLSTTGPQFSDFFTGETAYEAVVEQAFATWAAVAGFNFVYVPTDSASVDIRVGWGNFAANGLGEIGQASFSYSGDVMSPDTLVQLEDPANVPLVADSGVIGGLVYSSIASTLFQVALHEIGHALGMAHSTDPAAVMYPASQGVPNQTLDASDIAGIQALYADVACYAAGTRILTVRGEIPVQALVPGDVVPCRVGGRLRRVRWIGHRRLDPSRHKRPHDVQPIRVRAGAFGPDMPHRDLRLSPDHAVFAADALIPVRALVNGATVLREFVDDITYFHVELEDADGQPAHDVLLAEGLPTESYLDTGNRGSFANGAGATARGRAGATARGRAGAIGLHADFARAVWEKAGCAKLHVAGPDVATVRADLLQRATALGHRIDRDPDLMLCAPGMVQAASGDDRRTWRFDAPRGSLRLRSRSAVPEEMPGAGSDTRRLGVAVARIALNGTVIALDDPRLGAGFFAIERAGGRSWRWTDGDAWLHLDASGWLDITLAFTLPYWVEAPAAFGAAAAGV
jgi:predicted Zn-dependent protease